TNKFIVPSGTVLPARGYIAFDETQLGFRLKAEGETIFLRNGTNNRVLDAIRYEPQANDISFGRYPNGSPKLTSLQERTPGAPNSGVQRSDIIINEIMYDPVSRNQEDQYLELYNRGTLSIDLSAWKFISGISFTFPSNTIIAPNGYL